MMGLDLSQWSTISAFTCVLIVAIGFVFWQKRMDRGDLGAIATTFTAGYNIPAAIVLCIYVFNPDPPGTLTASKLNGFEKHFAFAGMSLLFMSLVGVWSMCEAAYAKKNPGGANQHSASEGQQNTTAPSGTSPAR